MGTWRQALLIAGNDLRRRVRDRSLLIQGILAPIALGLIVGLAFGGGVTFTARIGIADADGTPASTQISDAVVATTTAPGSRANDGGGTAPTLVFEAVPAAEVRRAVADGTVDAAIVLPDGLAQALDTGAPVTFQVIGHPDRVLSSSVAESVAESVAGQIAATRLAVATTVVVAGRSGRTFDRAAIAQAARGVTSRLEIAPRDVRSDFSVISYFAPAMGMLFLFFILGAGARSVVIERREGTLQRIRAAPVSTDAVLVGKTLGVFVLGAVSLGTVWAVTSLVFGVDWGNPLGVAAVLIAVVVSIAGIALLLTGLARTENQADAVTTITALTLTVVGGSFFFGAGGVVAAVKPFTPNGRAMLALTELAAGEARLVDVLPSVLLLLALGLVTGGVGLVALRRKVAQ